MEERLRAEEAQMFSQPQEAVLRLEILWAEARDQSDTYSETFALCLLAGCTFLLGDFATTLNYAQQAQCLAHEHGFQVLESRSHNLLGLVYWRLSQMVQSLEHYQLSLSLSREAGDDLGCGRTMGNIADIYIDLGDPERALSTLQEAVDITQRAGAPERLVYLLGSMAESLLDLDRFEEALALIPEIKAITTSFELVGMWCVASSIEARVLYKLERFDEGLACAEAGALRAQEIEDAEAQGLLGWILTNLYLATGDLQKAQVQLDLSDQLAHQMGYLRLQCELKHSRAALYRQTGDTLRALEAMDDYLALKETLHARSRQLQSETVAQQIELEVLQYEARMERQRNTELVEANRKLQAMQDRLSYQAAHDPLTGLLNRGAFWNRAEEQLQQCDSEAYAGVIFADIDHLKMTNDSLGHAAGDTLIRELAWRFQAEVRPGNLVGRLGGDEFMIYLASLASPEEIEEVAARLLRSLSEPLTIDSQRLQPSVSLGCAIAPQDGHDLAQLHHCADLALYQAKQQGKNAWVRYEPELAASETHRRQLKEDLQYALEQGQFELHYQPQFTLPERQLVGMEALLRWRHPKLGMISPAEFIPLAEENLMIVELGAWVLQEACCQAQAWGFQERGLTMSVNVSVQQFERPDFVQQVEAALGLCALPGDCLMLELTETILYQGAQAGALTVEKLHKLGVHIAIDDFGTGYSNMQLLRNLPFRQLKIDKTFVQDLGDSAGVVSGRHFMEVMLNLAHGLGIRVVAEGVETQQQFDLLSELGCDKAQGFLLSRPLPAGEVFRSFLETLSKPGNLLSGDLLGSGTSG